MKKHPFILLLMLTVSCTGQGQKDFGIVSHGSAAVIYLDDNTDQLIAWAANELAGDIEAVTGVRPPVKHTNRFEKQGKETGNGIRRF